MAGFTSNSVDLGWQPIAVPAVCLLISFLGYSSQWLFYYADNLDPGPLAKNELYIINGLLACLWLTYYEACTVDPGRFVFPMRKPSPPPSPRGRGEKTNNNTAANKRKQNGKPLQPFRWCRKCKAPKPARAHHCRHCKTCIPRMDHHCPWTANCVSYTSFPQFMRFLVWTNVTLAYYIGWLIYPRFRALYDNRDLPSYLGPSVPVLIHLTLLMLVGVITEFALLVMLVSTGKSWVVNTTMIESWEIEKHEALLSRGQAGCMTCPHPNDEASDFEEDHCPEQIEFPYDVGFFANMAQAMGSNIPLLWFLPIFGSTTELDTDQSKPGWSWPENGFNDQYGMWPPVDPEKQRRDRALYGAEADAERLREFEETHKDISDEQMKAAFRARQEADIARQKARLLAELEEVEGYDIVETDGWTNANGEKLADYGVEDDTDSPGPEERLVDDGPQVIEIAEEEEDIPLGEIIRRRKARAQELDDSRDA